MLRCSPRLLTGVGPEFVRRFGRQRVVKVFGAGVFYRTASNVLKEQGSDDATTNA